MKRFTITLAAALLLCAGTSALAAVASSPSRTTSSRPAYDPFAMQRAAQARPGTKEYNDYMRRQAIVKWLKDKKVKPPKPPKPKSPQKPDDDDDDGGDDDDDGNNGHGNDDDDHDGSNPGNGNGPSRGDDDD